MNRCLARLIEATGFAVYMIYRSLAVASQPPTKDPLQSIEEANILSSSERLSLVPVQQFYIFLPSSEKTSLMPPRQLHPASMGVAVGSMDVQILEHYHLLIEGLPAHYRISTGSAIKYLEVLDAKLDGYRYDDYQRLPVDQLPGSDWNVAKLVHTGPDDELVVASVSTSALPDVMDAWSGVKVEDASLVRVLASDEEALQLDKYIEFGRAAVGTAELGVPIVLAYRDPWYHPHSVLATDNTIRRLIQDAGISVKLLGHLSENGGRVIGFILEPVAARQAGIEDLEECQKALRKLHELGIAHGLLSRSSFLILKDSGKALLQGFFCSFGTSDPELLANEIAQIEAILQ